jgi:lipid A 3-O-deacylase
MKNQGHLLVCCFLLLGFAGAVRLAADPVPPAPALAVYAGRFEALSEDTNEVGLEWRWRPHRFRGQPRWLPDFRPVGGVMATSSSDFYAYAGIAVPFAVSGDDRWMLTPSFAPGIYALGNGKDLGGPVEFRSALSLTYGLRPETWVGLTLYHLSNGVLYHHNPGSESFVLTFVHGLGALGHRR